MTNAHNVSPEERSAPHNAIDTSTPHNGLFHAISPKPESAIEFLKDRPARVLSMAIEYGKTVEISEAGVRMTMQEGLGYSEAAEEILYGPARRYLGESHKPQKRREHKR